MPLTTWVADLSRVSVFHFLKRWFTTVGTWLGLYGYLFTIDPQRVLNELIAHRERRRQRQHSDGGHDAVHTQVNPENNEEVENAGEAERQEAVIDENQAAVEFEDEERNYAIRFLHPDDDLIATLQRFIERGMDVHVCSDSQFLIYALTRI